ncbi:hypothetical protein LV89_04509 [Arcicella aurantiaca]|uniref:Uncharacterized protein n=1 Tax=Arcicella aurantiaca TaxID=591202 RepID=A0A316DHD3_9BACT|nr:hypothetical protein [Arcicella aurantiaca]PWK17058.1 hypothetical protein LV89_04509 [Arcicella aurantiaca]
MKHNAQITFYKCVQDSQEFGSDNEHAVSRVFFTVTVNGKTFDYHCDIRQDYGSSFSYETDPLQVSNPFSKHDHINYEHFRSSVEAYYRSCVGASGNGIKIVGASNIRMTNNTFGKVHSITIETSENSPAW